jgi:flagellar protein FlgJ
MSIPTVVVSSYGREEEMSDRITDLRHSLPSASARDAPISSQRRLPVVDRQKVDPNLVKAAEGMEAMFLDYLMKVMRDTVPSERTGADASAHQFYSGMRDSEFAQAAAKRGGIGLADQIIAYMESQRYNGKQGSKLDLEVKPRSQEGP